MVKLVNGLDSAPAPPPGRPEDRAPQAGCQRHVLVTIWDPLTSLPSPAQKGLQTPSPEESVTDGMLLGRPFVGIAVHRPHGPLLFHEEHSIYSSDQGLSQDLKCSVLKDRG